MLLAALAWVAVSGCAPGVASESATLSVSSLQWETAPDMGTARHQALAAVVGTKIYVIGGDTGTVMVSSVEEFDTTTQTWTNCGGTCQPMTTAVTQAGGGPQDGMIYVVGGYQGVGGASPSTAVQVFDPSANTWGTTCNGNPCDAINAAQQAQVTSASAGAAIYLSGGALGPSNALTSFDSVQSSGLMFTYCSPTPCLPGGRSRPASVISGNSLYVLGGYDGGGPVATLWEYDVSTNTMTNCGGSCPDMPADPNPSSPGLVGGFDGAMGAYNGIVYAMGLNNNSMEAYVQSFDTATDTWTGCGGTCPAIPIPIGGPAFAQVGNRLYLFGGDDPVNVPSAHVQVLVLP